MRVIRGAIAGTVALSALLTVFPTSAGAAGPALSQQDTAQAASAVGTFYPVGPTRLLDTRSGLGAPKAAVTHNQVVNLQIGGRAGVPTTGVSAVVLNVTVTAPSRSGYLTVYPSGAAQPTASNVNFVAAQTIANSVTVQMGAGGKVAILHRGGTTHIIADIAGFYAGDETVQDTHGLGQQFQPAVTERILDTRDPSFGGPLEAGWSVIVPVDFGDFNPGIRALAVNITAVGPKGGGYLTSWSGEGDPPTASTLNFVPGKNVPNMAIVPVSPCPWEFSCGGLPSISILNGSGADTHILVDILGFYDDGAVSEGLTFRPMNPTRIADTRSGLGAPGAIGQRQTATFDASPPVSTEYTVALALNVTAVAPTAGTYLTVFPSDEDRPTVSTLNPAKGETVPNATITYTYLTNSFNVYNHAGSTHLVVDVAGSFDYTPEAARSTARSAGNGPTLRSTTAPAQPVYQQ